MQLETKQEINAVVYLKTMVIDEIVDYILRVANINVANPALYEQFFNTLEGELAKIATYRKFQVLNTNVIRETHTRVLSTDSIRLFYMELMTSINVRGRLELGNGDLEKMLSAFVLGYQNSVIREISDSQSIVQQSQSERQLVGQVMVTEQALAYLKSNGWYYGVILCNYFAAPILDQIRKIKAKQDEASNKSK